jgi:hypothetical protein
MFTAASGFVITLRSAVGIHFMSSNTHTHAL